VPQFETLVEDIEKLFDGKDISERVHHLTNELGTAFVSKFKEYAEERQPTLRMSNIGKPLRQLFYELTGVPSEPLSPQAKFKFLYGNILESLVLFLAREAGHIVTDEQKEVEVDGIKGHIDGCIDGVLVDLKSCSSRSFDKFQSGRLLEEDPFGYIKQLGGYKSALNISRAAFVAIDKVTGKICTYEPPTDKLQYNVSARIGEIKETLNRNIEPARCYELQPVSKKDKSGNLVLGTGCSYCGWKFHCYRDSNNGSGLQTRLYSTGPKYFAHIEKEPRLKNYSEAEEFPLKEEE
jgi:hypothetical protein